MAKMIDITEKLNFTEAPKLKIKNIEVTVNDDATTMLKIMQTLGNGENISPSDIASMYALIIPETDRKKLDKLKLNFGDFQTVVKAAISLATGTDMDEVEEKEQ